MIKTLGDEVMVVGSDPVALTGWAVDFQAQVAPEEPAPRIGIHYGEAIYRDGDYYGREVNQAARVVARASGGEVLVTRAVVDEAEGVDGLHFRPHRRGQAEGLLRADRALPRPRAGGLARWTAAARAARARCAPAGCSRRGRAASRDALGRARLDVPARRRRARCCGAGARARAARQLRAARRAAREDERHCLALCAALGVELEVVQRARRAGAGQPAGVGARAALRRAGPSVARERERRADRDRAHRQRPGRDDPLPARAPRPGAGRCSACPRARVGSSARCSPLTREQTAAYCRARGLALARGREQRRRALRARARAPRAAARRCARSTPRPEANVLRTAALLREETRAARSARRRRARRRASDRARAARGAARRAARLVVVRLAEQATGAFVPQAGERVAEILALGAPRRAAPSCTSGGRVARWSSDGVLRMAKLPPRELDRGAPTLPGVARPSRQTRAGQGLGTARGSARCL